MSTAVYYSNVNMSMEEKHTLPPLAQIMPPVSQQYQDVTGSIQHSPKSSMPLANSNYLETKYVANPQLEVYPTNTSNNGGATLPAQTPPQQIVPMPSDKCICKQSANKIPRPRNAFILFRQKYHQSVLDEGNVIRTNPEVSRELGRRWRALSADDKNHWNNLANEEKKNHAKKYPGYRYTPRRNGKAKNCPHCRQDSLRQLQLHNQQVMQFQLDQYQQYRQLQHQQNQVVQTPQQSLQSQPLSQDIPQYPNQHFVIASNPFPPPPPPQHNPQYQFPFSYTSDNFNQEKLSPISNGQQLSQASSLQSQPAGSGLQPSSTPTNTHGEYINPNPQFVMGSYEQTLPPHQRFNSLPTPINSNNYGFDSYNQPQ